MSALSSPRRQRVTLSRFWKGGASSSAVMLSFAARLVSGWWVRRSASGPSRKDWGAGQRAGASTAMAGCGHWLKSRPRPSSRA
ncbi:hypothetical protein D3C84_1018440 [compost metagenome]